MGWEGCVCVCVCLGLPPSPRVKFQADLRPRFLKLFFSFAACLQATQQRASLLPLALMAAPTQSASPHMKQSYPLGLWWVEAFCLLVNGSVSG